jgi:hypothetical protein
MCGDEMRRMVNLLEAIEWRGTADGSLEALDGGHTLDDAVAYIKQHYPFRKTWTLPRAEPGFRAMRPGGRIIGAAILRSLTRMNDTDSAIAHLGFRRNAMMSGSAQATYSIGWSWHVGENPERGIAFLYYQDRGMGSDSITLAARDKRELANIRQVFIDAGVIPDLSRRAVADRKHPLDALDADARMAEIRRDGTAIERISQPTPEERMAAVSTNGDAIRFIKHPTPEERLAAVRNYGFAIQHIKDPTPEERMIAVRHDGANISMITDPTPEEIWTVRQQGFNIRGRRISYRR